MAKYKYELFVRPPGWKPGPVPELDLPTQLTIIAEGYFDVLRTVIDLLGPSERAIRQTNEETDLPEPEWNIFVRSVEEVIDGGG